MIFGAISYQGKIFLEFLDQKIKKDGKNVIRKIYHSYYIETLEKMIPEVNKLHQNVRWKFQQDNAGSHDNPMVYQYLENKNIEVLDHPPQSPDLNPIENVWGLLKLNVEKSHPHNYKELKENIIKEWEKIPMEKIRNYINRLKKVMLNVKRMGGANTAYVGRKRKMTNYLENTQNDDITDLNFR